MYRIDGGVRAPAEVWVYIVQTVWVYIVQTQGYYCHERDLMMEVRFNFEYVREYLIPESFHSGASK